MSHADASAVFYANEYGLRPVINAMGSMTSLGGSRMRPECVEAMRLASSAFVDLNELLRRAGARAARVCRRHVLCRLSSPTASATSHCSRRIATWRCCDS